MRFRALAATAVTAALLTGCGGSGPSTDAVTKAQRPPHTAALVPTSPLAIVEQRLDAAGYDAEAITDPSELVNIANGRRVVALAGLNISGKGLRRATGYALASPLQAQELKNSISGIASAVRGPRLYFVGKKAPDPAFNRMVAIAESE